MILPEECSQLLIGTMIVDNAKRPAQSITEAAPQLPILCRYQRPHIREKRMLRRRPSRMHNRWESMPPKGTLNDYKNKQTELSCTSYQTINLVNAAAAMPLRMPVRSRDDQELPPNPSSIIDFLDEALAISEICICSNLTLTEKKLTLTKPC
jgi:hypothetical protein